MSTASTKPNSIRRFAAVLMAMLLLVAACAGDGDDAAADSEAIATNDGGILVRPPDVISGETEVVDGQDTAQTTIEEAPSASGLQVAPDAAFTWFDGTESSIAQLAGQPTVLNFWASTCPACIAEMPEFEEVALDLADQVRFVGMNTSDRREAADRLAAQTGVTYPLAEDPDGEVFRAFTGFVMPTTVFLNEAGEVAFTWSGVLTGSELRILIDEHIAPGTNSGLE